MVITVSCAKTVQEDDIIMYNNYSIVDSHQELSERDAQVGQIALAITRASSANEQIRCLISRKALEQFDGDYDILFSHLKEQKVMVSDPALVTKAGGDELLFMDVVEEYLPAEAQTKAGEIPLLQKLMKEYPELQISVPVHAEEWNPATFTPPVVFNLLDKDVEKMPTIPGYDAEGNPIEMDAVNAPDYPVIVVGYNERMGRETNRGGMIDIPLPPEAPTNLNYTRTNTSIILTWNQPDDADGYKVYKKSQGATTFSLVATINDENDRSYEDCSIIASQTYLYYVTAFINYERPNGSVIQIESGGSSIVTVSAPGVLPPLSAFSVQPNGTNLEFRWNNDGYVTRTVKVDYCMAPQQQYNNFFSAVGIVNKIMAPPVRGQRVSFMAYRQNSLGNSDALYDFIYPPYRNTFALSSVDVSCITYGINPESWFNGKPDFVLKAWKVSENGTSTLFQSRLELPTTSGTGVPYYYTGSNIKHIGDWGDTNLNTLWYATLALAMIEEDAGGATISLSFTPKIAVKVGDVLSIEESMVGSTIQFSLSNTDEDCGQAYFYYYENPSKSLLFPNYQVNLQMMENN